LRQLVSNKADVVPFVRPVRHGSNPRKDEEQAPESAGRLHPELATAARLFDPLEAGFQLVLIAVGAEETTGLKKRLTS
jgi:hypothetical protein